LSRNLEEIDRGAMLRRVAVVIEAARSRSTAH
jgi:hypothetical protein